MTIDQRRHDREEFIALDAVLFQDVTVDSCTLLDLSEGGAFVQCSVRPRIGAVVQIHGKVRGEAFSVDAVVRWIGKSAKHQVEGFGVSWKEIPYTLAIALAA